MTEGKKQIGMWIVIIVLIGAAFGGGYLLAAQTKDKEISGETRTVLDGTGREVIIPKKVDRVVSLVTGVTGIFYEIGAHDKVVGVTQSLPYPTKYFYPESEDIAEDVGSIANINVEVVVGLKPDVVITTEFFITNAQVLEGRGIPVVAIRLNSAEDLLWNVRFVGSIAGKTNESNALAEKMENSIQEIADKTSSLNKTERKKVYVEHAGKTYGESSWYTEFITKAGGINIYGDSPIKMPIPSYEYVVEQNPDAILLSVVAKDEQEFMEKTENLIDEVKERPGWSNIDAVKNNKFCVIGARGSFGPDMVDYVPTIGKFLHPYLFADVPYPKLVYTTSG